MKNTNMKARVSRLVAMTEEVKGTDKWFFTSMECSGKYNGKWKFVGNSIPEDIEYTVKVSKSQIYLYFIAPSTETPCRYRVGAEQVELIDLFN